MRAQASWGHALAAIAGIAVWLAGAPARAVEILDDPTHLDELAAAVQQTSNSLCWEMYRYHQIEPDFKETYRAAKDLWSEAGALRDALRAGAVESADAAERAARMAEAFTVVDRNAAKWRDGVRPADPM